MEMTLFLSVIELYPAWEVELNSFMISCGLKVICDSVVSTGKHIVINLCTQGRTLSQLTDFPFGVTKRPHYSNWRILIFSIYLPRHCVVFVIKQKYRPGAPRFCGWVRRIGPLWQETTLLVPVITPFERRETQGLTGAVSLAGMPSKSS